MTTTIDKLEETLHMLTMMRHGYAVSLGETHHRVLGLNSSIRKLKKKIEIAYLKRHA